MGDDQSLPIRRRISMWNTAAHYSYCHSRITNMELFCPKGNGCWWWNCQVSYVVLYGSSGRWTSQTDAYNVHPTPLDCCSSRSWTLHSSNYREWLSWVLLHANSHSPHIVSSMRSKWTPYSTISWEGNDVGKGANTFPMIMSQANTDLQLYDACCARNSHWFIVTNYHGWVFGAFSKGS